MEAQQGENFTFRCHRQGKEVFLVNDISFHPDGSQFATCGSDGFVIWWNKDKREKMNMEIPRGNAPITCCSFNSNGSLFGYAVGYDWSQGTQFALDNTPRLAPHIYVIRNT